MSKKEKIYNFNIELLHYLMENKEILDYTNLSTNDMRLILSYCEILEKRINKARKIIFDNYAVLDKYEIEILDDILKGSDTNEL